MSEPYINIEEIVLRISEDKGIRLSFVEKEAENFAKNINATLRHYQDYIDEPLHNMNLLRQELGFDYSNLDDIDCIVKYSDTRIKTSTHSVNIAINNTNINSLNKKIYVKLETEAKPIDLLEFIAMTKMTYSYSTPYYSEREKILDFKTSNYKIGHLILTYKRFNVDELKTIRLIIERSY